MTPGPRRPLALRRRRAVEARRPVIGLVALRQLVAGQARQVPVHDNAVTEELVPHDKVRAQAHPERVDQDEERAEIEDAPRLAGVQALLGALPLRPRPGRPQPRHQPRADAKLQRRPLPDGPASRAAAVASAVLVLGALALCGADLLPREAVRRQAAEAAGHGAPDGGGPAVHRVAPPREVELLAAAREPPGAAEGELPAGEARELGPEPAGVAAPSAPLAQREVPVAARGGHAATPTRLEPRRQVAGGGALPGLPSVRQRNRQGAPPAGPRTIASTSRGLAADVVPARGQGAVPHRAEGELAGRPLRSDRFCGGGLADARSSGRGVA
mmetsp:Transcript_24301/g.76699  ORF Transcript_24301/g.76699 Transcript_24301/m.76699 type:complete len:328 (+) Transcript_24301:1189-2172(+)